jgi:CO/xanthine dehydrogenase Mo-binding subunit
MPLQHVEVLREGSSDDEELQLVAPHSPPAWAVDADLGVVGQPYTRLEGTEKVTGRARYSYDIRLPGQLYARILRSPHPHARVLHVDVTKAAALPGVHAVLSAMNAPEVEWYKEKSRLFDWTVRFAGDEVAAVAAESEELAEDALRLVEVEYEELPFVLDMEAALQPDAPRIHDKENIAGEPKSYERGDVEAEFAAADVVIDEVYTTQTALHNALEPHGCTAAWEGDRLTLYESTQGIFEVREQVAQKLGLPEDHVRVIKEHMGGGFGAKQVPWKQTVIAALLSKQAGRPVQLMLDREGENLAAGNRSATVQHLRIGAKRDGTLTAIDVKVKVDVGAYMVGGEASNVSGAYERLYRCPNLRTEQIGIYTNAGPAVAFRAPGHVEAAFALESALDELAHKLNLDPIELRLRNYAEHDQKKEKPYSSPNSLRLCYERAAETFGWHTHHHPPAVGPLRYGIGMAAHDWGGAGHPPGYAWVKLNSDGTADIVTGAQDIGTGTRTGLAQVAAEELGLSMDCITLHLGDTAQGPYAPTSAGSATQATVGPAIQAAAADAKRQLFEAAAKVLEEEPDRLRVRDGLIWVEGEPENKVTVAEVMGRLAPHMIIGQGARGPNPKEKSVRTFGAQCVEVAVDIETGEVTVLRVVAAHDCGRVINPVMVESQVIGGITQGLGFALTEERVVDKGRGIVLNPNLEEYKVPTAADIPTMVNVPIDVPDLAANPTGAKGIGEPPLVPTAPAIANAVYDATGIRIRHAPLTRRTLVEALDAHATTQRAGGESDATV